MSSAKPTTEIDYPESDGRPMGETDLHIHWVIRIRDILKQRYRDERVYVGSDLLVYYEQGNPRRFVVPDDFVVFDCQPGNRRTFKTWQEQRTPDVIFEVTSRGTARGTRYSSLTPIRCWEYESCSCTIPRANT